MMERNGFEAQHLAVLPSVPVNFRSIGVLTNESKQGRIKIGDRTKTGETAESCILERDNKIGVKGAIACLGLLRLVFNCF